MIVATLPPDVTTLVAAFFLLVGVPAIVLGGVMVYLGYVRYDADRFLAELEAEEGPLEAGADGTVDPSLEAGEEAIEVVDGTIEPDDDGLGVEHGTDSDGSVRD